MVVTKPQELQDTSKSKQVRRSTGTTDKRLGESRLPEIANDIYREFDTELKIRSYNPELSVVRVFGTNGSLT